MTNPFRRKPPYTLAEVHTLIQDIDRLTLLRDKSTGSDQERLSREVESASRVLEHVLEKLDTDA